MKEKSAVGSPFFGAFPSDCIPKATKDVNAYFFIHSMNSCQICQIIYVNCTSEFPKRFEAITYLQTLISHCCI